MAFSFFKNRRQNESDSDRFVGSDASLFRDEDDTSDDDLTRPYPTNTGKTKPESSANGDGGRDTESLHTVSYELDDDLPFRVETDNHVYHAFAAGGDTGNDTVINEQADIQPDNEPDSQSSADTEDNGLLVPWSELQNGDSSDNPKDDSSDDHTDTADILTDAEPQTDDAYAAIFPDHTAEDAALTVYEKQTPPDEVIDTDLLIASYLDDTDEETAEKQRKRNEKRNKKQQQKEERRQMRADMRAAKAAAHSAWHSGNAGVDTLANAAADTVANTYAAADEAAAVVTGETTNTTATTDEFASNRSDGAECPETTPSAAHTRNDSEDPAASLDAFLAAHPLQAEPNGATAIEPSIEKLDALVLDEATGILTTDDNASSNNDIAPRLQRRARRTIPHAVAQSPLSSTEDEHTTDHYGATDPANETDAAQTIGRADEADISGNSTSDNPKTVSTDGIEYRFSAITEDKADDETADSSENLKRRTSSGQPDTNKKALTKQSIHRRRIFLTAAITFALLAITFVTLIFSLRMKTITFENLSYYQPEDIVKSLKMYRGDSLLLVSEHKIKRTIREQYPYIESVSVHRNFPSELVISVTQDSPMFYTEILGDYFIISRNLRVLGRFDSAEEIQDGLIHLSIADVSYAVVGETLQFRDATYLAFLVDMVPKLEESSVYKKINEMDLTYRYRITFQYDNRLTVQFGSPADFDTKMVFLEGILDGLSETDSGTVNLVSLQTAAVTLDPT